MVLALYVGGSCHELLAIMHRHKRWYTKGCSLQRTLNVCIESCILFVAIGSQSRWVCSLARKSHSVFVCEPESIFNHHPITIQSSSQRILNMVHFGYDSPIYLQRDCALHKHLLMHLFNYRILVSTCRSLNLGYDKRCVSQVAIERNVWITLH